MTPASRPARRTAASKAEERSPRRALRKVAAFGVGRLLLVGALSVVFGLFAVLIALQATRLTLVQWLFGLAILVPLGGAIAGILWYSRGLGRATQERERAEEAARASESGFRTVAATIADGIVTIDEKSRIQFANEAVERIFGYSGNEILGREITALMPEPYRARHLRSFRRYLDTGERHVDWAGIEFPGLHKSGREIPLEVSLGEYAAAGRRLFTGVVRDISERKRAQETIARSEEKFRGLFESAADGIFFIDSDGVVLDVNPAGERLAGRARTDFVGRRITDLIRSERMPIGNFSGSADLEGSGGALVNEGVLTTSDGRERSVEVTSQVVRSEGSDPQFVLVARDVTERRDLQRKLLESERWGSMGRLASFVAHEINTPLTNISLLTASIARRVRDPDVQIRLGKISAQGKIAASITAELLKFTKPGAMNPVDTDLCEIVRAAVEQADVYRKTGVPTRVELGIHPVPCRADPMRIQEVFVNLLKNAYEATATGEVAVRLEEQEDFLAVHVSDTGTGIPPEVQRRIFEPFFTTKKKGEGTGLGLALSKSFIVGHGGDISVVSEVGKGSTFSVRLPRRLGPEESATGPPSGGAPVGGRPPEPEAEPPYVSDSSALR